MVRALAEASEARGTDAAGIAYNAGGTLQIHKRPGPAHTIHFTVPKASKVIMGHTRMATQGSALKRKNNHPFAGKARGEGFALAHNGVLHNDKVLRRVHHLPPTATETDSYIAVQLMEQQGTLNFDSLRFMAEEVEGSFCFTVLDRKDNLYFVKGDNPLCLYHYPELGLYLYASTEEILRNAIGKMRLAGQPESITLHCGDILKIDAHGRMDHARFSPSTFLCAFSSYFWPQSPMPVPAKRHVPEDPEAAYLDELRTIANWYGYDNTLVDTWLADGFSTDEIEDFLYCGEL
ncbi:class II glutamine amidotransferase [Evtepia sp.]|uniref:class II glutamine amidotransferase n=1 Tax=Evtepia sp. TaxID=2773933 RepID=UPI00399059D5